MTPSLEAQSEDCDWGQADRFSAFGVSLMGVRTAGVLSRMRKTLKAVPY